MKGFQNLLLVCVSLVALCAVLEVGVRVFVGPVAPPNLTLVPQSIRAPAPSPDIPYLLAPNASAVHDFGSNPRGYFDGDGTLTYRINSLGLRDREIERQKAPGTFRILGIGDSFTFGTGVRREHLYLTRLQELFDVENPGRIEVLNLGVMGFNTAHELALLREIGTGFDPDLVIVFYVLNDAKVLPIRAARKTAPSEPVDTRSVSLLLDHVRARLASRRSRDEAIRNTRADYLPGAPGWRLVQRSLSQMRDLARERGFELAVIIFPVMWELNENHPYAEIHATVTASAERLGLPVLDLFEAFRGEDGPSLWVHPSNQHPNERAHAIAARAIHAWLVEERLVGGASDGASK